MTAPASLLVLASAIRDVDETECVGVSAMSLELPSTANLREHHHIKAKRQATHRVMGGILARRAFRCVDLPAVALLTRIAPRALDDDNLASAFKAVRDGVADILCVDDRDSRVTWLYAQRKGPAAVELGVWRRR